MCIESWSNCTAWWPRRAVRSPCSSTPKVSGGRDISCANSRPQTGIEGKLEGMKGVEEWKDMNGDWGVDRLGAADLNRTCINAYIASLYTRAIIHPCHIIRMTHET